MAGARVLENRRQNFTDHITVPKAGVPFGYRTRYRRAMVPVARSSSSDEERSSSSIICLLTRCLQNMPSRNYTIPEYFIKRERQIKYYRGRIIGSGRALIYQWNCQDCAKMNSNSTITAHHSILQNVHFYFAFFPVSLSYKAMSLRRIDLVSLPFFTKRGLSSQENVDTETERA